jgi:phosphatidylglycerol:prolipoprotein diacylglycerol transferase
LPFLAIPFPAIDPVLLQLGPFAIRWYALAYIAGIVLGWIMARRLVRRPGWVIDPDAIDDLVLYITLGIILGGRLGYVLFYQPDWYLSHPLEILHVWRGGMSFHGGLIGIITALFIFAWRRNIPVLELGDLVAAVGTLGSVLRADRQLHQCRALGPAHGRALGRDLPRCRTAAAPPEPALRGSARGILLFIVVQLLAWRPRLPEQRGQIGGAFLAGYALCRFTVEFFREPDAQLGYLLGGLTMGQLLSLPMLAGGLLLFAIASRPARVPAR